MIQTQFIEKKREVTAEEYDNMLGAVPPVRMDSNAFLCGEAVDHVDMYVHVSKTVYVPRYECYFMEGGKYYYAGLTTTRGYDLWRIPMYCTSCGYVELQLTEHCIRCNKNLIHKI